MPPHEPAPRADGLPRAEPLRRAEPGVTPETLRRRLELPSSEPVRALYEAGRYLDALALTREAWRSSRSEPPRWNDSGSNGK